MRLNGEAAPFHSLREQAEWASVRFLRLCFNSAVSNKNLKEAGDKALGAIERLRDAGEEW